jgi:hypothetical protein
LLSISQTGSNKNIIHCCLLYGKHIPRLFLPAAVNNHSSKIFIYAKKKYS